MKPIFQCGWCLLTVLALNARVWAANDVDRPWEQGNYQAAADQYAKVAGSKPEFRDFILFKLKEGCAWRAAGLYEKSNNAFGAAADQVEVYDDRAKHKVSQESLGLITNLSMLDYEGYAYDKIMMSTYAALNYIQLGDFEHARVEFNRALEHQRDAVELNAARLEKAKADAQKQKNQPDLDKMESDPKVQGEMKSEYSNLDEMKAYADYVNPITVYLDGLFFLTQSTGNSDYERSRLAFDRVHGMIGDNKFIKQDMETIAKAAAGQGIAPATYIIFESGEAPIRKETRLNFPIYLSGIAGGGRAADALLPKLEFRRYQAGPLTVAVGGTNESTVLLSSMDSVIGHEFKNDLPEVMTRTLTAAAAQGTAAVAINQATGRFLPGLGNKLRDVLNKADLRTWNTLPKEFYYCRIPTPADRKIELVLPGTSERTTVTIADGSVNLIWVKSPQERSPLLVTQCKLKK